MKMKNGNIFKIILCVTMGLYLLTGCGTSSEDDVPLVEDERKTDVTTESDEATESGVQEISETEKDSESKFSFADISDLEFWFSSGAGGWSTVLIINEDGIFEGEYHDSDMGEMDEEYPKGTMYLSNFTGKFTKPQKVNEYTYSMKIESIELYKEPDTEEIKDGIRYIYSEPYGLNDADEILIYLPGASLQELPEEYRSWVGYYDLNNTSDTELPFYGLYNVRPQYGFSSYEHVEDSTIDEELSNVKEVASSLENKMQNEDLNQMELNNTSIELYKLWDEELNIIWSQLKETLSADEMAALTKEEREWILYKESEMEAAGAEYEGGSMQAMIEYNKGAELTEKRVYELVEMLR